MANESYQVESGDSLWKIAEEVYGDGSQWTKIYEANQNIIDDPNLIYPNQNLVIPTDNVNSQSFDEMDYETGESSQAYTVESGDCLWNIAERIYGDGNEWTRIYEANQDIIADPDLIYPGQELTIPMDHEDSPETPEPTENSENSDYSDEPSINEQTSYNPPDVEFSDVVDVASILHDTIGVISSLNEEDYNSVFGHVLGLLDNDLVEDVIDDSGY